MDLASFHDNMEVMIKCWVDNRDVEQIKDTLCQALDFEPGNSTPLIDAVNLSLWRIPGYALEDQVILATRYALLLRIDPFMGDLHEGFVILSYLAQETLDYIKDERNPRVMTRTLFRLAQRLGLGLVSQQERKNAVDCFYEVARTMDNNHGATYLDELMVHVINCYRS